MGFAVLHIEKGTAGKAGGLGSHIDRTKNVPNADPALSEKNFYVRTDFEKGLVYLTTNREIKTLQERINGRIQEGYKGKTAIRKDAVTRHIREALIFTVPERGSSRWILSRKELWIKYLQQ